MPTRILGIETSCDETAVAVVEDGGLLRSNVIASQIDIHARYGGVVPEVASRQHVLAMTPTVQRALDEAGTTLGGVQAVAVTAGPGLAGSLLVGVNVAKALALTLDVPLLGVNHLEGHVYASWLEARPDETPGFPLLCLIASGGHTDLLLMSGHGQYRLLGRTRDDAAGEAFDKAARVLGLGFPGGPHIQRAAQGAKGTEALPRAWMKETHDFSFSGLKTALLHRAQALGLYPDPSALDAAVRESLVHELAFAFQESIADVVATKTLEAAKEHGAKGVVMGGGVIANKRLRELVMERSDLPVIVPRPVLCTDNGAMVAACAYFQLQRGGTHALDLDVDPSLRLG